MESDIMDVPNRFLLLFCFLCISACSHIDETAWEDEKAESLVSKSLIKFESLSEFEIYIKELHKLAEEKNLWWVNHGPRDTQAPQFVQNSVPCDPNIENCDSLNEEIVVTGSMVSSTPSITNNQSVGVDEGDIVKRWGNFLIVLQDGRLFSVEFGKSVGSLQYVDRIDIYQSPDQGVWFDELLISGNMLVVTGFSWEEDQTEIVVFSINDQGIFNLESKYFIESEDYYSAQNYASRLTEGKLLLNTSIELAEYKVDDTIAIPRIRQWTESGGFTEWQDLFEVTDLYRPIQQTLTPVVHVLSVCELSYTASLSCSSRGIVGPYFKEFYVSAENVYYWLSSDFEEWGYDGWVDGCPTDLYRENFTAKTAAVYQMPIASSEIFAVHTYGAPADQFVFKEAGNFLHALLIWERGDCYFEKSKPVRFTSIPLGSFGDEIGTQPLRKYSRLPAIDGGNLKTQYTDNYLAYGTGQGWYMAYGYGRDDAFYKQSDLVFVPTKRPRQYSTERLRHSSERIERIGDNLVVFGYRNKNNFGVSTIDFGGFPYIADVDFLPGIVEYEGRSHAFNSLIDPDNSGVFGLPTIFKKTIEESYWNDEVAANVNYFRVNRRLGLYSVGALKSKVSTNNDDYECDVSCEDWYGNARPIFIDDRIFALSGSEIIEGTIRRGEIQEINRVNLTHAPLNAR